MTINERSFKTVNGLKIRLDLNFFEAKLSAKFNDENYAFDKLKTAIDMTENTYMISSCLLYLTTVLFMLFSNKGALIFNYIIYSALGCCIGILLRYVSLFVIDYLAVMVTFAIKFTVCRNWLIKYLILLILTIITKEYYISAAYLSVSVVCFVAENALNLVMSKYYLKKYDIPFNDTEIIFFNRFNLIVDENYTGTNRLIYDYCDYING